MSLNDKSCSSTPSIVRDAAHFGACTIGSGGFSTTGAGQFNDGFSVTDGTVEFGGQSQTAVLGQWQFTYGFTSLGDTIIGATTGTHTLVVRATETHHGTETHNGANQFNGDTTVAEGKDLPVYQGFLLTTDVNVSNASPNVIFYNATVNGCTVRFTDGVTAPNSTRKTIKNMHASAYSFTVVDNASSQVIGVIAPGQTVDFICYAGSWR